MKMKLTIRTANQEFSDLNLECTETMSVQELKNLLSKEHPAHPPTADQRLICSGRLLANDAILKDTLIYYGSVDTFIVHLVCKSSLEQKAKEVTKPATKEEPQQITGSVNPTPPSAPQPSFVTSFPNGYYMPMSSPMTGYPAGYENYYAAWMQNYTAYMNAYVQRLSSVTPPTATLLAPSVPASSVPVSVPLEQPQQAENPINPEPVVPENELRRRPVGAPVQQPQNLNPGLDGGVLGAAQVEAGGAEAEANRDWLDWVYMLTRLGILICFAFLYSSLHRIIGVIFLGIAVYLYQKRRARLMQQRRANESPAPPAAPQPPAPQPEDDNNNSNEPNPDQVNNNIPQGMENNPELRPEVQEVPPQPSAIHVVKTALVAFVTSLIPDHQNLFN